MQIFTFCSFGVSLRMRLGMNSFGSTPWLTATKRSESCRATRWSHACSKQHALHRHTEQSRHSLVTRLQQTARATQTHIAHKTRTKLETAAKAIETRTIHKQHPGSSHISCCHQITPEMLQAAKHRLSYVGSNVVC